ncbi:MAG: methyltransferase domain-containing protein [Acidimicrobiia bacterium]|nr:methyltransferase domain-containing protein [Acidimicrobiia bacterium]
MACRIILPALCAAILAAQTPPANRLAPPVPSPQNVVEKMLEVANLKPGETLYDLGSGDGRVLVTAAQQFGAKAFGVEISPEQVHASNVKIRRLKLEESCKVIEGDLLKVDLSQADVVTIYLLTASNDLIRPNLEKYLKPGARVVSHDYPIRGWQPSRVEKVEAFKRHHTLYVYEMPQAKK